MSEETLKSLHRVRRNIFLFHLGWVLMVLAGTIIELINPFYARIQIWIIIATALFQMLGQGHCPLTLFENLLLEKCDPEKMYCNVDTYQGSFIRHCLKKYLRINAPRGTTIGLLIIVLIVTIIQLVR